MSFFLKIISLCFLAVTLTACKEKLTYNYLLQHPFELKKAVEHCQAMENKTEEAAAECSMVMDAADKTMTMLKDQQADPEKFGEKLLIIEIESIKAKAAKKEAEQVLMDLKAKNASEADIKVAEEKVQLADKAYQGKCDEKRAMLAIVGLSSPE